MAYKCRNCGEVYSEIPADAVVLAGHGTSAVLIKTKDGRSHDLKLIRPITEAQHRSRHKKNKTDIMCRWCYPEPKPEVKPITEHVQDANQAQQIDQPDPTPKEEAKIDPPSTQPDHHPVRGRNRNELLHPETEDSGSAMRQAFNRLFRQQEDDPEWRDGDSLEKF